MAVNPMLVGGIGVGVTAAAVTGGLYAGGVIGGGSSSQESNTLNTQNKDKEPDWRPLYDDQGFLDATKTNEASDTYKGKWGEKYAKYLLGAGTAKQGVAIDNKVWWNKKLGELKRDNITSGKFNGLNEAHNTTGTTALNKVCDAAYKSQTEKVKASDANGSDEFDEGQVWQFCSVFGTKVETLKSKTGTSYDNTKYGGIDNNKPHLVYAEAESDNKWFWDLKQAELKDDSSLTAEGSEFKKLKDRLNSTQTQTANTKMTVREICKDAYNEAPPTAAQATDKYPKAEVFKFCSLTGKEPASA